MLATDPHCWYCGRELDESNSSVEHIQPRSKGGDDSRENLLLACRRCNGRRGLRDIRLIVCDTFGNAGVWGVSHLRCRKRMDLYLKMLESIDIDEPLTISVR